MINRNNGNKKVVHKRKSTFKKQRHYRNHNNYENSSKHRMQLIFIKFYLRSIMKLLSYHHKINIMHELCTHDNNATKVAK